MNRVSLRVNGNAHQVDVNLPCALLYARATILL
jgi:hypothetical protein